MILGRPLHRQRTEAQLSLSVKAASACLELRPEGQAWVWHTPRGLQTCPQGTQAVGAIPARSLCFAPAHHITQKRAWRLIGSPNLHDCDPGDSRSPGSGGQWGLHPLSPRTGVYGRPFESCCLGAWHSVSPNPCGEILPLGTLTGLGTPPVTGSY